MEQHGNTTTFNLESVLRQNILESLYYRNTVVKLSSWQEVVDEIYYSVKDCEPWLGGNARGASTAFCLLHRLFELKISIQDIKNTLDHPDSPYIRALGLLYLRYVCNPKQLWDWFMAYIRDKEEFSPSGAGGKTITIGDFARDILLDQYYFETIFPRVPKPVLQDIEDRLKGGGFPTKPLGNAGQGGVDRRGVEDSYKRPASVKASLSVAFGQRAPNRAGAREEGRGMGSSLQLDKVDKGRSPTRRGNSRDPSDRRAADDRRKSPDYRPVSRHSRSPEHRRRSPDQRRRSPEQRRRSPGRPPLPGPRPGDQNDRRRSRSRSRDRRRERSRDRKEPSRDRRDGTRDRHRRRSRSPDRKKEGRDASDVFGRRDGSDVFRKSAASASGADLRDKYGDLKQVALHDGNDGGKVTGKEEVYRIGR